MKNTYEFLSLVLTHIDPNKLENTINQVQRNPERDMPKFYTNR